MELFKIFGTIALTGSDKVNRQLDETTQNAEESASKLSKVGGFLKGVAGAVALATGALVTGAVGLVKKVSASYGELQQSIGGVETLYGESAQKVIENANNAFRTAGISANEYMQQVTSFTASLLQSLEGDTAKTADVADMAVRDMADNANKFGTSMEDIQNAYQGFSKQNYTMLDNLKLGYGGTKTEMQRLLKDAEKISGIKYDISSLSDVYNAIHVIQQELGVTGTTAQEAGETIQGSFNSLSSAWQNFLAGLGDPNADMKQLTDNLASTINTAVTNVIPVINNMVEVLPTVVDAIINAISEMLPTLIKTFTDVVTNVLNAIVQLLPNIIEPVIECVLAVAKAIIENLPLIVSAVIQLVLSLAESIREMLPTLIDLIIDVLGQVINIILENLPLIIEVGVQLILALINGILGTIPTINAMLPQIIEGIVQTLVSNLPLIISCALQIVGALITGLLNAIPSIIASVPQLIVAIINGLLKGLGQMFGVGEDLMNAFWDGLESVWNNIVNWFSNIFSTVGDWFDSIIGGKGTSATLNLNLNGGKEFYADGGVMTRPTVFGYNPSTNNSMIGGEAGAEAIAPISTLQGYVSEAVKSETSGLNYSLDKLISMLSQYLPNILNNMDRDIVLDSGALVGSTATKMDKKLGNIALSKARYGV